MLFLRLMRLVGSLFAYRSISELDLDHGAHAFLVVIQRENTDLTAVEIDCLRTFPRPIFIIVPSYIVILRRIAEPPVVRHVFGCKGDGSLDNFCFRHNAPVQIRQPFDLSDCVPSL